jgi:hypothetical protein
MTWFACCFALALVFAGPAPGASSPPRNDNRANAQVLRTLPAEVVGTTVGATAEAADPQCQTRVRETVWYRFSRATSGTILVSFQGSGQLDAVVSAFEVVGGQLKLLRCQATDAKGRARFVFETHPKPKTTSVYLLLVGQRLNSDPGSFKLSVGAPERPANDERAGAAPIGTLPATVEGTTLGATHDEGDPGCAADGGTVWYRLERVAKSRVIVGFHAGGNLEATVCAVERVRSQLRTVASEETDDRGNASFEFDGKAGATYYLVVSQPAKSEPGPFQLKVSSPPRPGNDERAGAVQIGSLPAKTAGTTLGATHDDGDPDCAEDGATVWYRLARAPGSRVIVRLAATSRTEAIVCVLKAVGGQRLRRVAGDTDRRGNLAFDFDAESGSTYYLVVSRPDASKAGPFQLTLLVPEKPPVPPGEPLPASGGRGSLDPLLNPADAWSATLLRGVTYRVTALTPAGRCVSVAVYSPRARSFERDEPVAEFDCGATRFFTPGPDGGGAYPLLVEAGERPTTYRLVVRAAEPDDMGPGVRLQSGERVFGSVSATDQLDLYRFDVTYTSDVRLLVKANRDLDIRLASASGGTIARGEPGVKLIRVLGSGTYYVAISPGERAARYQLRVLVRYLTKTGLTVNKAFSARVKPGVAVSLLTTTSPSPGGGRTRVQADYFDIAARTWVFRKSWDSAPGSVISFVPDAVGEWRVRATFYGTQVASPSRSAYRRITVGRAAGRRAIGVPPTLPGEPLAVTGVRDTVNLLRGDLEDAWAVTMKVGSTYRLNLVSYSGACLSIEVLRPGSRDLDQANRAAGYRCREGGGVYGLFTPGPDGGGVYTVLVGADLGDDAAAVQNYRLQVAPAGPDDTGPGLPLPNRHTAQGRLSALGIDVVDLYRFDVTGRRDMTELSLGAGRRAEFDLQVLDDGGRVVACECGEVGSVALRQQLAPGTYYAAVQARGRSGGAYRLSLLIRPMTSTSLWTSATQVTPGQAVRFSAQVSSGGSGVVEFQVDRFDPLQGWVFSRRYSVRASGGAASATWVASETGRWRVRATFLGTGTASPSRSAYRFVLVTRPATQ